jgi:hypothetical protein
LSTTPTRAAPAAGRDDFSKPVKQSLAQRAGYMCSAPDCKHLTIGPSEDRQSGVTMVGVAAHIASAARGGARYDKSMSPAERAGEANGIWLCQTHGKLVDDTPSRHSVEELKRWKLQHEDWVFARVANAGTLMSDGITSIEVTNLGPFRTTSRVELGRTNIVYGSNGAGKSTLCEALAALAGGAGFARLEERWKLFGRQSPSMVIEASVAVAGARTLVRLSEEPWGSKNNPSKRPKRLHVEVDGNVAPRWPQDLFNIVIVESLTARRNQVRDPFRRALRALAPQLSMTEDQVWDTLREELFCSTPLGFRVRRTGRYKAEVQVPGSSFYVETGGLGGGEHSFAIFDILVRLMRADPRQTPWMLIVDSDMFLTLDGANKRKLIDTLTGLADPRLQTIFCVNHEEDATDLSSPLAEKWIRSTDLGELTIHSFL